MSSSLPETSIEPNIYCQHCAYDLRACLENRCPECGREFDPANPRTYANHPSRPWLWKWTKRVSVGLFLLLALPAGYWGWLYWGWWEEQQALTRLGVKSPPRGWIDGNDLVIFADRIFGPANFVLERVGTLDLSGSRLTDQTFRDLKIFSRLFELNLSDTQVSDADLVHLKDLPNLNALYLCNTPITDAGLAHLQELVHLATLDLSETKITDEGLKYLPTVKEYRYHPTKVIAGVMSLRLNKTRISDAGLKHLRKLTALMELELNNTQITDAGLVHLQPLPLGVLELGHTRVTDAGLMSLKDFEALKQGTWVRLDLSHTLITDAGLVVFTEISTPPYSSFHLILSATAVTDAGVDHLLKLKGAGLLDLRETKVTPLGFEKLKKALPHMEIDGP